MVKINQGLTDFSEPEEGDTYQIISVSDATPQGYKGLSVEFTPKIVTEQNKKIKFRITAWLGQKDVVGTRSKLGSFISAFTDFFESQGKTTEEALEYAQDTDNWLAHFVKIIEWRSKNREIKVIS